MERLIKHGFVSAGYWFLEDNNIHYSLYSCRKAKEVLYAFIYQGEVKYIGKTDQEIEKRMYGYRRPNKSQSTNIKVHNNIREILDAGKRIDILILVNTNPQQHGDYIVNLAAGLEGRLISNIKPEWNGRSKNNLTKAMNKIIKKTETTNDIIPNIITTKFDITLRNTYYDRGFFNVPTVYTGCFGQDGKDIEMRLENKSSKTIIGKIDRKDNRKTDRLGTPRIKGSTQLREWIQENFEPQEVMKIEVLSRTSIRLYK